MKVNKLPFYHEKVVYKPLQSPIINSYVITYQFVNLVRQEIKNGNQKKSTQEIKKSHSICWE
jgi:hypothetical protein